MIEPPAEPIGRGRRSSSRARPIVDAVALAWRAAPATLLGLVAISLAAGTTPVGAAWLTKMVIDRITRPNTGAAALALPASGLAIASAVIIILAHLSGYLRSELDRATELLAHDRLFTSTGRLMGLARLEDPEFQDQLRLAAQASRTGPSHVVASSLLGGQSGVTLGGFLVVLISINPGMAALALTAAAPAMVAEIQLSRRRASMIWQVSPVERRRLFYASLLTSLESAKEIRLLGLGSLFRRRMLNELRWANTQHRRLDRRELAVQGALGLLSAGMAGAGLVWVILAARTGQLTAGDVSVGITAVAGIQMTAGGIVSAAASVHHALLLFEHHREVLASGPDLPDPVSPRPAPALRRGIEFDDVWFRYTDNHPWVLRGVNLVIPFGHAVALVGRNGAGKSTIIKLLCRFYDPTRGTIRWDGEDLRTLSIAELRRRIGALFQDFMTYDLSAAENIGLGDLDTLPDPERIADLTDPERRGQIEHAARLGGIHDTIVGLPSGYHTLLSRIFFGHADKGDPETGVLLSGGQRQRLALARTFLRDRRDLLILDEPSAGLDAEAEHEIHTSLRHHRAGLTSLLISHRLSVVRDADLIIVIADGHVIEQGTHADLLTSAGTYAQLFNLQASGYGPPDSRAARPLAHRDHP